MSGQTAPALSKFESFADTIPSDTLRLDSFPRLTKQYTYTVSEDSLEADVTYTMEDSMRFGTKANEVHLWGNAVVEYQSMSIKADYIVLNMDSSIATAIGMPDSAGVMQGSPVFTEGNKSFEAQKMRFNFKTSKGIIYQVVTTEGDLFVHGSKTKFVGGGGSDTSAASDDHIYTRGALITTCNAPEPHYGIRSTKIKTVPDRLAVIGPSNIELNGVPTPFWLPFGFFPVTSGKRSGLMFPNDYEYDENWGFGLREVGWYFPISDNIDAKVLGDIYFNGSWGIQVHSNYVKRYAYRGSVRLGYSVRKSPIIDQLKPDVRKSFTINISHSQDSKAHPYRKFGGSINMQSNDYRSLNQNDANSVLTNSYSSNFSWSRTFPGKPYSLSIGLRHSQNTRSRQVSIDAPNVDFRLNRIYPFKRKPGSGKEQFYERISFQYSGNSRTKFLTTDTTIFTRETWQDAQFGMQHKASSDLSFSLFNYIHVTPSINYEEIWFLKTLQREFVFDPETEIALDTVIGPDGSTIITMDTLSYGSVMDTLLRGFKPYRHYSTSISVNTQLFATMQMKKGLIRGLRHVLKPTFSFSYEPDNSMRYYDYVQTDLRDDELDPYSIFQGGLYSARIIQGERAAIGYSFNNIFEAKLWSKKDSTEKKIKLFDNIVVSGDYNIVADSFNFSRIGIRGTTRLFKNATTFSFSASYDPYDVNPETGRRINAFYLDTQGKLLRFESLDLRFSTRLTVRKLRDIIAGKPATTGSGSGPSGSGSGRAANQRSQPKDDKFFDLMDDFSLNHNLSLRRIGQPGKDTTIVSTHTVNMRGSMRLSPKWSISIGNIGYDFRSDRLTYPDIGFVRDLHCWDLRFSWQPQRGTYTLHIGVKPGSLDFIKIPHNRNLSSARASGLGGF